MSDKRPLYRSRMVHGRGRRAPARPLAAGWAAQHRLVARTHCHRRRHGGRGAHPPRRLHRARHRRRRRRAHPRRRARPGPARGAAARVHAELGPVGRTSCATSPSTTGSSPSTCGATAGRSRAARLLHGRRRRGLVDELRAEARMAAAQQGSPGVRRMAVDVRTVLEALEVEHALVVGHSMGGMVALQLAHDTPRRRAAPPRGRAWCSSPPPPAPSRACPGSGAWSAPGRAGLGPRRGAGRPVGACAPWRRRTCAGGSPGSGSGPTPPPAQVRFVEGLHLATPSRDRGRPAPVAGPLRPVGLARVPRPPRARRGRIPRPAHRRPATPCAPPPRCPTPSWSSCPAAGTCPCSSAVTSSPA